MAVVKDDLMTIFLGKVIGATGLGYLGWAKKWAEMPLRFLMDNVSKVAFPAFSRLQEREEDLKKAVEKSVFFLTFLTFPALVGMSMLAPELVKLIPRYLKWQPALLALYFYCFNSAWAVVSTSMTNLLNAIGRIKTTFKLMVMWLVLTWALMPILAVKVGYNGVALAAAIIALSSAAAIYIAQKQVRFNLFYSIGKPFAASLVMGLVIFLFNPGFSSLGLVIALKILVGMIVYMLVSYFLVGGILFGDIQRLIRSIASKDK